MYSADIRFPKVKKAGGSDGGVPKAMPCSYGILLALLGRGGSEQSPSLFANPSQNDKPISTLDSWLLVGRLDMPGTGRDPLLLDLVQLGYRESSADNARRRHHICLGHPGKPR